MKIFGLFILGFILSFIFTPWVRKFCLRFGFLDIPQTRKIHDHPIPRLGGIAIILSFLISLFFAFIIFKLLRDVFLFKALGLLTAVALLILLGLIDDIRGIRPLLKLFWQIMIGWVLFSFGFRINFLTNPFSGQEMQIPNLLSLILTIIWVVGTINAVNLIDGLDGLAAGIVFISGACLLFVGLYLKTSITVILLSILCANTLGFLYYNFPPAKIFLGDIGSMFLGLILAVTGLVGLQYKVVTAVALIIPICALAIPIYDTVLAMWRRLLKKGSIFIADKRHLHHRLLELGFSQRQIVVGLYLVTVYFGIIAFLFVLIPNQYALLLLLLLGIGLFFGIRAIGFVERKARLTHALEEQLKKNAQ
jgi:UDP-GlcNAc:undecaprenyl-phosphate GlcNAc-1-phosphate transferase